MLVYAYGRGGATEASLVAVLQLVPAASARRSWRCSPTATAPTRVLAFGYLAQAAGMGVTARRDRARTRRSRSSTPAP